MDDELLGLAILRADRNVVLESVPQPARLLCELAQRFQTVGIRCVTQGLRFRGIQIAEIGAGIYVCNPVVELNSPFRAQDRRAPPLLTNVICIRRLLFFAWAKRPGDKINGKTRRKQRRWISRVRIAQAYHLSIIPARALCIQLVVRVAHFITKLLR